LAAVTRIPAWCALGNVRAGFNSWIEIDWRVRSEIGRHAPAPPRVRCVTIMTRQVAVESERVPLASAALETTTLPAGQGLEMAKFVRSSDEASLAELARIVRVYPAERDAIIGWLFQNRGGALVRQLVEHLQTKSRIDVEAEKLGEAAHLLDGQIDFDLEIHDQARATRDASFAGWTSEAMASAGESVGRLWDRIRGEESREYADEDVALPPREAWSPARAELALGRAQLAGARAKEAAGDLAGAQHDFDLARVTLDRGRVAYLDARRRLSEYRARVQGGIAGNITLLHGVEGACITIAAAATGAWVGGVLAAGAAAGTGTAVFGFTVGGPLSVGGIATVTGATAATTFAVRAATSVATQAGEGHGIDPLQVITDAGQEAAITFATGLAGGLLGKLFSELLGKGLIEAAERMGYARLVAGIGDPGALADQIVTLIGGVTGSAIVTAVQVALTRHVEGRPMSAGDVAALVVKELMLNGVVQSALLGMSRTLSAAPAPGARGPATPDQLDDATAYAAQLNESRGLAITTDPARQSSYEPATNAVNLGNDLAGGPGAVGPRGVVAHEVVGHADAANTALHADGTSATATNRHPDLAIGSTVEEMQASYRAALHAPDLTMDERLALIRDGNARRARLANDEVYVWADESSPRLPNEPAPDLAPALGDGELPFDILAISRRVLNRGTPDIPVIHNPEVLTEQFAHAAYNWAGDATAELAAVNGYVQGPEIHGAHDLAFRVFSPTVAGKPPIIAFRGTVPTKVGGILADVDPNGVGVLQFDANRELIQQAIAEATQAGGPAVMTGHSLGGALAQLAGAEFPDQTRQIITFASPGVNKDAVLAIRAHNAAHPGARIDSIHHQVSGDLVSESAANLTDGMVHVHETTSATNPLSKHAAAILGEDPTLNQGKNLPAAYMRGTSTRLRESIPIGDGESEFFDSTNALEEVRRRVGEGVWGMWNWWQR
jgi:hypothetical protein